jgi:CubicO group peptidase (beta-lactamase class C family)
LKKYSITILTFLCFAVAFSLSAAAKNSVGERVLVSDFSKMDEYIESMMQDCRIPGFSVAVVRNGKSLYMKGYGVADENGRSVTSQTPFLVGSVSKTFTALAVMQLVEAGKVELDKPVQTYLPDFTLADADISSKITVQQLLNHTSGIGEAAEDRVATLYGDQESVHELVRKFRSLPLKSKPGSSFEYGNAGYIILGDLIETVSGLSYGEYVQRYIFEPLEMRHSYTSAEQAKKDGLAIGYRPIFGFPKPSKLPYRIDFLPAYSVISSAEDMTNYMIAMSSGGKYNGFSILSEEGIRKMTSATIQISPWMAYGLGWYVTSGSFYHGGLLADYQASIKFLPEDDISVVLMYNTSSIALNKLFKVGYRERIESGIINAIYGISPTEQPGLGPFNLNSYPISVIYGLALVLAVLISALIIFSGLRLLWISKRLLKSKLYFWRFVIFSVLMHFLLPLFVLVLVPIYSGVPWRFAMNYAPDASWFIMISSITLLLVGLAKAVIVVRILKTDAFALSFKKIHH